MGLLPHKHRRAKTGVVEANSREGGVICIKQGTFTLPCLLTGQISHLQRGPQLTHLGGIRKMVGSYHWFTSMLCQGMAVRKFLSDKCYSLWNEKYKERGCSSKNVPPPPCQKTGRFSKTLWSDHLLVSGQAGPWTREGYQK